MAGEKFNLQCAYNETFSLEDAMGYKTVLYICSTGTGRSAVDGSVLPKRPCSTASLKEPVRRPLLEFVFLFSSLTY